MKKLILVDGNSIIFRAYYATAYPGAKLMQTSQGIYTNALFAFINMVDKIKELSFDHILFAFDSKGPTKRHLLYEDYKAGRKEMPEELAQQFDLVYEYLDTVGFHYYNLPGYEADDIIGTLARIAESKNYLVDIYSSDRDLLQLVTDKTTVNLIKRGMSDVSVYDPKGIKEEFDLECQQMIDFKALTGDPSDNIPGIPGVGPKTAIKLLNEYETLENILSNSDNIKGAVGVKISENRDLAIKSKILVTIDQYVPIPFGLEEIKYKVGQINDLILFYQKYELHSLARNLIRDEVKDEEIPVSKYIKLTSDEAIKKILTNNLSVYLELDMENYHQAEIWGMGLSDGKNSYFISPKLILESPSLKNYLADETISKYGFNIKELTVKLRYHNLGREELSRIAIAFECDLVKYDELIYLKGAKKRLPEPASVYEEHIASKAKAIHQLREKTLEELKVNNQLSLLNDIEIPLSLILAKMEFEGIKVDLHELKNQHDEIASELNMLTKSIYQDAGMEFNLNSPKQLGDVLFEVLQLPHGKRTKTGYSTNQDVLNKLVDEHPIIDKILRYRTISKLFQTYINGIYDSLLPNSKVHTIYQQALTATGRLSSIEPNLQNIPIRTKEGREIRKMFIPSKPNNYFLSADYSQIELRVLAHVSKDKKLIETFRKGIDIHSETARQIFKTTEVTPEMRHAAKAVNFGIIYGISDWGLSEDLKISVIEAEKYITSYLEIYPEVSKYMANIVKYGLDKGYVETIFNRRRYLPELYSPVYNVRKFGERLALNAPIQGSAADILKKAMIDIDKYLTRNNFQTKILLQVHDELVLEVPKDELELMENMIPKLMTNAVHLLVDLPVSVATGKSWYEV
jgi:DNA polymerase-1